MGAFSSKHKSKDIRQPPRKQTPKKGGTVTSIDRATLDLKVSRDKLAKYRTRLNLDSDKLAARAKALHADGKTKDALQLLRLRKYKQQNADRIEEQLLTVLLMVDKIAEKQNESEVVLAMKQGKDALKIMHDEMGIDDVLDLMDNIKDEGEMESRINEILGKEGLSAVGEEDVLAELELLEEEARLEEEKQEAPEDVVLPTPPKGPLPAVGEPKREEPTEAKLAVAS